MHRKALGRFSKLLAAVSDWFIPESVHSLDFETIQHTRIVASLTLLVAVIAAVFVAIYFWVGGIFCAIVLGLTSLSACGGLILLRYTGRAYLVGNLTIANYLATITVESCLQGGPTGTEYMWFFPIPLAAFFLSGERGARLWFITTLLIMGVFFALHLRGYEFYNEVQSTEGIRYVLNLIGVTVALITMSAFHEVLKNGILVRLREARDTAEVATRAKSEFLANMSHEIRTPMTAILGFAEQLASDNTLTPAQLSAAHTIDRNGRHLLGILNDVLDFSKIEAGKFVVKPMKCRLSDTLQEVASLMQCLAESKHLTSKLVLDGPIPELIWTDPVRLRQILINLIGNATKFTPSGEVRLVVRRRHESEAGCIVEFDVTDTGIGMRPDQLDRLFRPFEQADTSDTRAFGGTGLGLTISRQLARQLAGDITVESNFGKGSVFHLSIPTEWVQGQVSEIEIDKDIVPADSGQDRDGEHLRSPIALDGARILVAEDGLDNQRLISLILRKAGAEVTLVQNGQEAIAAVFEAEGCNSPFDIVLMDMQMPVMDGYTATRTIREAGGTLPIIALTAHAMSGDRDKCLAAGCTSFATKPIDREVLISVLQQHCKNKGDKSNYRATIMGR